MASRIGATVADRKAAMKLRETNVAKLTGELFDVCIIGGGINGAVSAASLAARGVRVALVDRGDFAGVTSQSSSNLAWGGIKYMESFEFGLVRKLCLARNRLIAAYPSTVQPIPFYVTHPKGFRRARLLVWLGAWLYWFMGSFFTKTPRLLSKKTMAREEPIVDTNNATGGVEYVDAHLHDNDARFVWDFVRSSLNWGCIAANYIEVTSATREADGTFALAAKDTIYDKTLEIRAKVVVNACGPFADAFNERLGIVTKHKHVLSKGVHLIVRRLTESKRVLTFFADDGRLFFMIPMGPRTCIGTTDTPSETVERIATPEDRRFILDNLNERLKLDAPLTPADIIAERCGVRPLAVTKGGREGKRGDWTQLSRKHVIESEGNVLTIFGGKITDCLNVGEEIFELVGRHGIRAPFPDRPWFGEPPDAVRDEFFHQARLMKLDAMTAKASSEPLSPRLWRRYRAQAFGLLEAIRQDPKSAELLIENAEYIRCEIEEAAKREMVIKLEDFLRRRSKISLVVSNEKLRSASGLLEACKILFEDEAEAKLQEYFADHPGLG
jgi:glycerol-3-phosphate dehydrogenase